MKECGVHSSFPCIYTGTRECGLYIVGVHMARECGLYIVGMHMARECGLYIVGVH